MRRTATDGTVGEWTVNLAWTTAIGAFLGLLGPFGSFFNGPVWQRVFYWTAMAWLGLAVFGTGSRLIMARLRSGPRLWTALAAMVLVLSIPFGLATWTIAGQLWPVLRRVPNLSSWVWYLESVTITAPQVALFAVLGGRRGRVEAADQAPRLAAGLLGVMPSEVLCLQMEDHYVRVHTAGGSRLVLATMAQATAALGQAPGLRIHRSWWVADRAVSTSLFEGRNLRLLLSNGVTAPVARSSVAAVRQADWLARSGEAPSAALAPGARFG